MAELEQVSLHIIRVFRALESQEWLTAREVSEAAKIASRTARSHLARMARIGVAKEERVFGGYRYRLASGMTPEATAFVERIKSAAAVLEEVESKPKKPRK